MVKAHRITRRLGIRLDHPGRSHRHHERTALYGAFTLINHMKERHGYLRLPKPPDSLTR